MVFWSFGYREKIIILNASICVVRLQYDIVSITFRYMRRMPSCFHILTHFFLMLPFDPPENIRKPLIFWCFQREVFWCFQGDQKGTLGRNGLSQFAYIFYHIYFSAQVGEIGGYEGNISITSVDFGWLT